MGAHTAMPVGSDRAVSNSPREFIGDGIERCRSHLKELDLMVGELVTKLSPVLRPDSTKATVDQVGPLKPSQSEIGTYIDQIAFQINDIRARLAAAHERIDL